MGVSDRESLEIRRATPDDYEAVVAMTEDIWVDRGGDYLPEVYSDWLEDPDTDSKRTFLADAGGDVAGIVQAVMLSADEAWYQGMRVAPSYRRRGVSQRLNEACFEWSRERGARVGRIMVYSWNASALGAARSAGFGPVTEFRWAQPGPAKTAAGPLSVSNDPADAWRYWVDSAACEHLRGLGLDDEESWAIRELTREDLARLADETAVFAVDGDDDGSGMAYRTRTFDRKADDETRERWAEYGVGAWDGVDAARSLFAAISRDAAALEADRTRVLIPETVEFVSDASFAGSAISEEPDFVLGVDLTQK